MDVSYNDKLVIASKSKESKYNCYEFFTTELSDNVRWIARKDRTPILLKNKDKNIQHILLHASCDPSKKPIDKYVCKLAKNNRVYHILDP